MHQRPVRPTAMDVTSKDQDQAAPAPGNKLDSGYACRLRLVLSLTAGRCYAGGGAFVDGAPGVFAAGVRAISLAAAGEGFPRAFGNRRRRAAAPRNVRHFPTRDELGGAMIARAR